VTNVNYVKVEVRLGRSSDLVEIAKLHAGKKVAPFVCRKPADALVRITRITNQHEFSGACDADALASFAGARNMPLKASWS
jgi:hypothetical protein